MRETIDFHNQAIDGNEKYPMFGIEIKKYSGNENDNFISTQIYPFNSEELRKKSENNSNRYNNNQDKWDEQFDSTELSNIEKEQILQFKTKLKKLIKVDEGEFVYGTGKTAAMMPRFTSSSTRTSIILYADGVLRTQLAFLEEEYGVLYEELKNQFIMLDYVKKRVQLPNGRIEFSSDPADWLPHRDEILSILDKVLVKS